MEFLKQEISGLYLVNNFLAKDERGLFVKTFHNQLFAQIGFNEAFVESYYSQSFKKVVRGMHFQVPPHDHEKLVYVTKGEILDVVLDLRKTSLTYGKFQCFTLKEFGQSVFIPKGCAHGFKSLTDDATVVYNVTTVYNNHADAGVLWNSFGCDWQLEEHVISARDSQFPAFTNFNSPF
jgi:dTDP-4-dehydrorhamnose 3,5-epimerase